MKIRSYKLSMEDFKDQSKWISPLITPINNFMSDVSFTLNNNLTVKDNLKEDIKELDHVENPTNYPVILSPTFGMPKGLTVIYCKEISSGPVDLTSAPFINYEINSQGKISISSITSLVTDSRYLIRIRVLYE